MSVLSSFERSNLFEKMLEILNRFDIINLVVLKESSDDSEEVTPVPIPNTEVKLFSADGSWGIPPARVGRCWSFVSLFEETEFIIPQ